jgi:predicted GNAT family acetyltransferase
MMQPLQHLLTWFSQDIYKPGTRLMGDYYGIYQDDQLVSITGERMRMYGLTEVSAVVTHPAYTGRKVAHEMLAHVVNKNLAAGIDSISACCFHK